MNVCARCGAELGVGRFCLNCGHPVGAPVEDDFLPWVRESEAAHDVVVDPEEEDRPNWLAWVLTAVGLVVVVLVLINLLGGDDVEPRESGAATETATPEDTTTTSTPTPLGKPRDVTRSATVSVPVTAPATTDLDGTLVAYTADQMLDSVPTTTWRMPGDGTGTVITFTLPRTVALTRVGLINGYTKRVSGVDWYPNNRRLTSVQWAFDDGSRVSQTLVESRRPQFVRVPRVLTKKIRLTITGVTPPGAGDLGRDYTAISEVRLIGRPTG